MEIIAWVGFAQGLFSALLMGTKSERSLPDKILTGWLSLLAIEFLSYAIDYKVFGTPLLSSSFLLFNPAFFLYVKSLTNPRFSLRWIQLLHLLPFLFFETMAYVIREPYSLDSFFSNDRTLWFRYAFSIASLLSWVFYNTYSTLMVARHRIRLKYEFSTIERQKKLGWILFIMIFYNVYCFVSIVIGVLVILFNRHFNIQFNYNYSTLLATIYILSFYGLRQKLIYQKIYEKEAPGDERYRRSYLGTEKKGNISKLLLDYFVKEKPYLDPELNMQMLSENLEIPKHQLTEVLNMEIGKNFYQFVNEYRVNEVKKLLGDTSKPWSIEAIGYESGFNSKSTFFTVFKSLTGQTPMQYKMNLPTDRKKKK